jgi:hypothetical protein
MVTFHEVMKKLKAVPEYPIFIRHINGDTLDNRVENLCFVKLKDAFRNISTWKVDWVCYLDAEEIKFLHDMFTQEPFVQSTFQFEWKADRNFCVTAKHALDFESDEAEAAREGGTFFKFALTGIFAVIGYYKTKRAAEKAMVECWNSETPTHPCHYSFLWNKAGECVNGSY